MLSFFYAIWKMPCWKCGRKITVALDACGLNFIPCDTDDYDEDYNSGLWPSKMPSWLLKHLRSLGSNIRFLNKAQYYANVCPYCGAVQSPWFLHEELLGLLSSGHTDIKIYEIRWVRK